jgi:hypothetical protein
MLKAGIKIPLALFSWAIQPVPSRIRLTSLSPQPIMSWSATTSLPIPLVTASGEVSYTMIENTYGVSYTWFIKRIISEWDKIVQAYTMPTIARIGWYEFVQSGGLDHVFVDIIYTGSTATGNGIYDAKILYQFDKTTYARKLIGFFEYNAITGYYTTKTGKNIFPGVKRVFVADPRTSTAIIPARVSSGSVTSTPTGTTTVTYADIETAYTAKRYLTTISLSNTWLALNSPTLDVLRIRYRTYFIIAKYTEALTEIEKIRSIWQLSTAVACEGYVIATYAKNTTAADGYNTICKKK